ncbi:MAG TPA: pyridoxal-phosphate dependent enzyme [Candidatus Thermoplasmatota archaeon]|nr:pyridoxal-phosphate dependent enzyme [Candidatus Thermoplasmatota archaeon]
MRYHENILSTIGNTPLVKLGKVHDGAAPLLLAKLEYFNPGGSVKDRIGPAMVEAAERDGTLRPGGTIVEGTSGNTGVGLALAAALKGYRTVFTMNDKQSREKQLLLKAFGARVVVCPTAVAPDDPRSYYSVAKKIHAETPNSVYPDQYSNQANPQVHYRTTGPEIWSDTDGKVTHLFIASGTGGTISGIGKFLKEKDPKVKVVGVDPEGSILREYKETGEYHPEHARSYKVEGFGEDIIPKATWWDYIDEFVTVSDKESFLMARRLAREEGVFGGGSGGSAVAGMLKYVREKRLGPDAVCVVIIPDSGQRYVTKFYSDEWMEEQGYLEPIGGTSGRVGDVLKHKGHDVLTVAPEDKVRRAVEAMAEHGFGQVPVVDAAGRSVGAIFEKEVMLRALENPAVLERSVREVMQPALTTVEEHRPLADAVRMLREHEAVLVQGPSGIAGILTRADLVAWIGRA